MSTSASTDGPAAGNDNEATPADVLVIFGITGDLAKVMTFRSLYRLEMRGLLTVRSWASRAMTGRSSTFASMPANASRARARRWHGTSSSGSRRGSPTSAVTSPIPRRTSAWRAPSASAKSPVFYLEIPPFLFGPVIKQLRDAGLTKAARVVVEKPFGHDLASARALAAEIHQYIDESQLYRIDHFLGKMGTDEFLYLRFANSMIEPVWNRNHIACVEITMAEDFGVEDRGHFYDPVGALRDVVVNHLMQVVAVAAMEAPASGDAETLKDAKASLFKSIHTADPAHYVRGQYDGYLDIDGVAKDSTHRDLRCPAPRHRQLALGGRAVVHSHRQAAPDHSDRAAGGLSRAAPPRLHGRCAPPPGAEPVRGQARPLDRDPPDPRRAPRRPLRTRGRHPRRRVRRPGRRGADPLRGAAARRDARATAPASPARTGSKKPGGYSNRSIQEPPPVHSYAPGSWGPAEGDALVAGFGTWHGPWVES